MNEQNIDLVIFGGMGDLAGRKLLPALYQIERSGLLSERIRLAVVARENIRQKPFLPMPSNEFAKQYPLRSGLNPYGKSWLDDFRT